MASPSVPSIQMTIPPPFGLVSISHPFRLPFFFFFFCLGLTIELLGSFWTLLVKRFCFILSIVGAIFAILVDIWRINRQAAAILQLSLQNRDRISEPDSSNLIQFDFCVRLLQTKSVLLQIALHKIMTKSIGCYRICLFLKCFQVFHV